MLHKVQIINTFRLYHDQYDCSDYQLETWITFAVSRNVQTIDLSLNFVVALPRCLFTCKTLVDLSLYACDINLNTDTIVCLPCLKKLCLFFVQYENDEFLPHLLSGCPSLEELMIELMMDFTMCYFNISSPTIKSLSIYFQFKRFGYNINYGIEINTPALRYLHIVDSLSEYIYVGELTYLIEADVVLHNNNKKQADFLSRVVLELVDRLCNVKCLKLDLSYSTKIVDSEFSAWTISNFYNLTKLELSADCRSLSSFLVNADNLEILIFWEACEEIKDWVEPKEVPKCLLSHLRNITLIDIVGTKHELEIVRYILRNAKVLEKMEVVYQLLLGSEEKIYVLQEISMFQRGSQACEVAFIEIF